MSASRRPWIKWYTSDWRADQAVQSCSLAARGLWHEMLGLMHEAEPYGYLLINGTSMSTKQLARQVRADVDEVETLIGELETAGVFSRDRIRRIYSRRMKRDREKSEIGKIHAARRWAGDSEDNDHPIGDPMGHSTSDKNPLKMKRGRKSAETGTKPTTRPRPQDTENIEESLVPNGDPSDDPMGDPMLRTQNPEPRTKKEERDSLDYAFENWWPHVPRKVDKQDARKAFKAAIKKIDLDLLIAATDRWAETCAGTEPRYVKHPARWLRGECWNNEYIATTPGPNGADEPYLAEFQDDLRRDYVKLRDFMEHGYWHDESEPKPGEDGCRIAAEVMAKYGPSAGGRRQD